MRTAQAAVWATVTFGALLGLGAMTTGCREKKADEGTAASSGGGSVAVGDKILIGHIGSMTGDNATFGKSTDDGVRLAIDEQNAKGGIKGKKITLETLDDQGKPEEAAVAATRLITQDKVSVVLGEVASSRSLAIAPIADSNKVPMISNASTNPRVTKDGAKTRPYVFRVCFIDPFQGTVMAKFAHDTLKISKVAVLRDVGNDYSVGLAQYFSAKFQELGGQIVTDQSFKAGDQDFKAQLTTIKGKNPEAIYVPGYYTEVALIGRQARELGIKQPLMGGDGWDSEKTYEIAKGALDGGYFSNHYAPEDPAPVIQAFVKKYKAAHANAVPDAMAVLGYDAARVAFAAMERAPDLSSTAIRDAIEQTKDFPGVSGTITLDKDHNAVKSAVVMKVENNEPKYMATISP
jgi:branched-chain amino acid transport system substrate-binding protein